MNPQTSVSAGRFKSPHHQQKMTQGPWLVVRAATVVVVVVSILGQVHGYPNGAPGKDCWTDRPLHGNYLPAHDTPPYEIVLSKLKAQADPDTYSPGEMINVTIRSRDGTPFKGYLMKVYSSNGVSRGIWGARKNGQHVLKRCGVTHSQNKTVTQTTILWVAPKVPVMDNIQFKAIIVKNYTVFYNNILSRPLKPNYPTLSFDRIFRRLVAFANMNFNISVPTISLPDPKVTSLLDSSPSPAASDVQQAKGTVNEVKVTGSEGNAMGTDAPTSGVPASSGLDTKLTQAA